MSELSIQDMQRELHNYALEEMRNRGLESAARHVEQNAGTFLGRDEQRLRQIVRNIRGMKVDPASHLSDWWAPKVAAATAEPGSELPNGNRGVES